MCILSLYDLAVLCSSFVMIIIYLFYCHNDNMATIMYCMNLLAPVSIQYFIDKIILHSDLSCAVMLSVCVPT